MSPEGREILRGNPWIRRIFSSNPRDLKQLQRERYDLAINMDEEETACKAVMLAHAERIVGARWNKRGQCEYTRSSAGYFDLSLLNRDRDWSLTAANQLKHANQNTYLELWMRILRLDPRDYPRHYEPQLTLSEREQSFARLPDGTASRTRVRRSASTPAPGCVGIPDCIHSGEEVAERFFNQIETNE